METIQVNSWREFEEWMGNYKTSALAAGQKLWFRGQEDSTWKLESTLERRSGRMSFSGYYQRVNRMSTEFETLANQRWKLPTLERVLQVSSLNLPFVFLFNEEDMSEVYRYFVHLRHVGFPSPLLDWTESPYIAAFFAFWKADVKKVDKVSIYSYSEGLGIKCSSPNLPDVVRTGKYIRTHRRHWLQKAEYTACVSYSDEWQFEKHEDGFATGGQTPDSVLKVDIPAAQRETVLALLDNYTINEYSLFDSEDMLASYLARQQFG